MASTNTNGYKVDFVMKTILVTREFQRKAQKAGNQEHIVFKELINDLPDFTVCYTAARKRKPANKRLTYEKMIDYICRQENAEEALKDFNAVRNPKDAPPSSYFHVRSWFMERFPNYGKMPAFDENGKLIAFPNTMNENEPKDAA